MALEARRCIDAYNYASNLGEVAFLFAFGSLCARCAELLVYSHFSALLFYMPQMEGMVSDRIS